MMSNDEMIQNVFRRTDEYFDKRKKRNSVIVKGASFMSLFGVIIAAGLGLLASNIQDPVVPEEPSEIQIVTTAETTTAVSLDTTETVTVTSLPSVQLSVTTAESGSDTVTTAAAVTTTAAVSIETTAGVTTSITTAGSETLETTVTSASTVATDTTTAAETTTEPAVTEPSPAATDLDKSMYNVVSVGEDFITVEIYNIDYDYMTIYNRKATYSNVYLWRYVEADFYVVTADSEEELAGIVLPEGAELAADNSGYKSEWEYIDNQVLIGELTDPYILVKGAEPEELYKIEGVKNVYAADGYSVKGADIVDKVSVQILTSVIDRKLTIEDFAGIDGITAVNMGSKSYYTEQMEYTIEFENTEKSDTRLFDICKSLAELESVDCVCLRVIHDMMYYSPSYVVELVENTNADSDDDIESIVIGDADGNGTVDLSDAVQVLTIYAEKASGLNSAIYGNSLDNTADVNSDGNIDLDDAAAILTYYAQTAAGLNPSWDEIIS